MFGVAQVRVQFRLQATLDHGFGQFLELATFSQNVLGLVVILEQFIDQFASNGHFFLLIVQLLLVQVMAIVGIGGE